MPKAPTTAPQPSAPQPPSGSPQKVNFTARYKQRSRTDVDELEEFWKLPQEDFENCDPVQWWASRRAQFGSLSKFACDIFTIPGELAVVLSSNILNPALKGLPLLSNESSQAGVIQFPYAVQV
jgi:hAT family C-terminal dimerisation region